MRVGLLVLLLVMPGVLPAQIVRSVRLHSEFQRVDPFGKILEADRARTPREILSPGVARNGYFSVRITVTADPKTMYFLAVQANPPNLLRWKIYQEIYLPRGSHWIPDGLAEKRPPYFSTMPDPELGIDSQNTQSFLLDVWVPNDVPVGRVRLEVLVKSASWQVYPMEVRILEARIPGGPAAETASDPSDPAQAADASVTAGAVMIGEPATLREVIRRNALQDEALRRWLDAQAPGAAQSCKVPVARAIWGAEWYLRVRDCLNRQASQRTPAEPP